MAAIQSSVVSRALNVRSDSIEIECGKLARARWPAALGLTVGLSGAKNEWIASHTDIELNYNRSNTYPTCLRE
jgi:hypothetical protein